MELKLRITKRGIITTLILFILLIVYNVLFFVIPFDRSLSGSSYWLTYGVTTFLVLFMFVVVYIAIGDKNLKSRYFGVPIIRLGYGILIIQFIFDAIIMIIGNWFKIPSWITIVIETLLLACFFISLITRTAYKDTIKKIDNKEYKESYIKELRIELSMLCNKVDEPELKKVLEKLNETVRYTDPVSNRSVVDIEDEISRKVEVLNKNILDKNYNNAIKLALEIDGLLKERKLRARASR